MGFIVTPLGTFQEGTEQGVSQEIAAIRPELEAEAEKTIATEERSFRQEIVTKVEDLVQEVESR